MFWWVFIFSSPLGLDHGHVLGRLGILGVQVPLFDLRLILLLGCLEIMSCVHLVHDILELHRRIQMSY